MSLAFSVIFPSILFSFFFNDTATTEIYTLSLHDALPIFGLDDPAQGAAAERAAVLPHRPQGGHHAEPRSEEHTSELQSQSNLVCRLLLEKKKNKNKQHQRLTAHDRPHSLCNRHYIVTGRP